MEDKTHLRCSCCGGSRHTKEGCFKIIDYLEWWEELRQRKVATKAPTSRTGGKANMATSAPHISDISADEPTHRMKARDDKNGDTSEQT